MSLYLLDTFKFPAYGQQVFVGCGAVCYWTVPAGVTQISAVLVGGGGGGGAGGNQREQPGGGGGGLRYVNGWQVTPGETLEIYVGCGGTAINTLNVTNEFGNNAFVQNNLAGENSYILRGVYNGGAGGAFNDVFKFHPNPNMNHIFAGGARSIDPPEGGIGTERVSAGGTGTVLGTYTYTNFTGTVGGGNGGSGGYPGGNGGGQDGGGGGAGGYTATSEADLTTLVSGLYVGCGGSGGQRAGGGQRNHVERGPQNGSGGAGAGGMFGSGGGANAGGGGGGVGVFWGQGTSGVNRNPGFIVGDSNSYIFSVPGGGGSGGDDGVRGYDSAIDAVPFFREACGGRFGGGGGAADKSGTSSEYPTTGSGGQGVVRILYAARSSVTRSYPSTNVNDYGFGSSPSTPYGTGIGQTTLQTSDYLLFGSDYTGAIGSEYPCGGVNINYPQDNVEWVNYSPI